MMWKSKATWMAIAPDETVTEGYGTGEVFLSTWEERETEESAITQTPMITVHAYDENGGIALDMSYTMSAHDMADYCSSLLSILGIYAAEESEAQEQLTQAADLVTRAFGASR